MKTDVFAVLARVHEYSKEAYLTLEIFSTLLGRSDYGVRQNKIAIEKNV